MAKPKLPKATPNIPSVGALPTALTPQRMRLGDSGLDSIRTEGRIAYEEQAPMRASIDAEVAEQMANLPARSKAANEALGLYHPVGGGIKLSKPTYGMHSTTVPDPAFNPPEIGIITPQQMVKEEAAIIPLVGDRAAGGRYLTHVGENEFAEPVRLTAGPLYMDANYNQLNPEESAGWESGAGRVTALSKQAQRAGLGGRPVYGMYTAGSATNTDFNVMGANALIQQIPFSKITKKAEKEFDLAMRNATKNSPAIPDWPGIRSPKAREMLLDKSNGIMRVKLFDTMGKENFQSMGFPDVPATRKAIIQPELLDVPTNQAGFRLARMDTSGRIIENPLIPSDYPVAMAAKVAGQLDVPADYKDIFQTHFENRRLLSQPESGDYYSFSRAHPIQYADDEWLNKLLEQRLALDKKIKTGEYAEGGMVETPAQEAIANTVQNPNAARMLEMDLANLALMQQPRRMAEGGIMDRAYKAFVPAHARTFIETLAGNESPITEKNFSGSELDMMRDAIKRSRVDRQATNERMHYEAMHNAPSAKERLALMERGVSPQLDQTVGYQHYPNSPTSVLSDMDPRDSAAIRNTLGRFAYEKDPEGNLIAKDLYKFRDDLSGKTRPSADYSDMSTAAKLWTLAKDSFGDAGVTTLPSRVGSAFLGNKAGRPVNVNLGKARFASGGQALSPEEMLIEMMESKYGRR